MLSRALVIVLLFGSVSATPRLAVAVLQNNGDSTVTGTIHFQQEGDGDLIITADITGLIPSSTHGFHVHQYGDTTQLLVSPFSTGLHFTPPCTQGLVDKNCSQFQHHGFVDNPNRHLGDFGNIVADADGRFRGQINAGSDGASLAGFASILGRAIAIHTNPDDGQQPFGNAGHILAAGVIAVAPNSNNTIAPDESSLSLLSCNLYKVADLQSSQPIGTLELAFFDLRNPVEVRARVSGLKKGDGSLIQLFLTGDLTNPPTSLGETWSANPNVRDLVLDDSVVCNGNKFFQAQRNQFAFTKYAGVGCALRVGGTSGTITAVGVFAIPNADIGSDLEDPYFTNGKCELNNEDGGDSGLSGGAIAGIVIGVLVGVALVALLAHMITTRQVIDLEAPAHAPLPHGPSPSQRLTLSKSLAENIE